MTAVDQETSSHWTASAPRVVAALEIAGGFACLWALPMLGVMFLSARAFPPDNPWRPMLADPVLRTWMLLSNGSMAVLGLLHLVNGIGLVQLRRWAWYGLVGLLVTGVLWHVTCLAVNLRLDIVARTWAAIGQMPPTTRVFMNAWSDAMMVVGAVMWLAVHTGLLVLSTRPGFRAACNRPTGK